jgi:hypothetical protein
VLIKIKWADKNKEEYETPEFHTPLEWAEERFVMVYHRD